METQSCALVCAEQMGGAGMEGGYRTAAGALVAPDCAGPGAGAFARGGAGARLPCSLGLRRWPIR